jgi:hypothetical protein
MAFFHSPKIPTSGLCLALDAGNPKSYPGSGTTWTDLTQRIPFGSYGTQTPFTTIQGVPCFDFNGSGYWQMSNSGDASKVDMVNSFTLVLIYYYEAIGERDTIFQKNGTFAQSYQQELACTVEAGSPGNMSWYRGYSDYDYANTRAFTLNTWNFNAIKGVGSTTRSGYYWNPSSLAWTEDYTNRTTAAITPASSVVIGNGYAGVVESGAIAAVYVWSRDLSNEEIKSVYMNFKYRYPSLT